MEDDNMDEIKNKLRMFYKVNLTILHRKIIF